MSTMAKLVIKSCIISIVLLIGYKSMSISKIDWRLHSNMIFFANNITLVMDHIVSSIPISTEPCDAGDKYRIRASRKFNKSEVKKCLHAEYHTQYYDDIVNTFCASINVLYGMNVTFVIVQGTLLSILRKQPILPWDADADIYLVLDDTMLDKINDTNITNMSANKLPRNTDDYDMFYYDGSYDDYFDIYDNFGKIEELFEKVKHGTEKYKSNAKNGKEQYRVTYDADDAPNIFRFVKQEAMNWGCTGYTDIYVITVDLLTHTYDGGDAGVVADKSVDLDYLFPVKHDSLSDWFPHWNKKGWNGETLNRDTIPIPAKPHELSELAYPNHLIPDKADANLTCTFNVKGNSK